MVTVLFADLVGFTARAEALDPEDVPEADEQLARALAYYRAVGASFYVAQGEALLAKTA